MRAALTLRACPRLKRSSPEGGRVRSPARISWTYWTRGMALRTGAAFTGHREASGQKGEGRGGHSRG